MVKGTTQPTSNFWELVKVWNNNPNDKQIPELESKLTKDEISYFRFHKLFDRVIVKQDMTLNEYYKTK